MWDLPYQQLSRISSINSINVLIVLNGLFLSHPFKKTTKTLIYTPITQPIHNPPVVPIHTTTPWVPIEVLAGKLRSS